MFSEVCFLAITIKEHTITLSQLFNHQNVKLIPMTDGHLPILYEWNQMPDILYWCEGDDVVTNTPDMVDGIYGSISQKAFMFIVTIDGAPVGDCWLQELNLDELIQKHPGKIAKRIDVTIYDKLLWNTGIGTCVNSMLLEFGFIQNDVDLIYAITEDYNERAQKCLMKSGFVLDEVLEHDETSKGKSEFCYVVTKENYHNIRAE